MNAHIEENELKLLAYLHEHARGFDQHFQITPDKIMEDLNFSDAELKRHSSYLAAHRLAGVENTFVGSLGMQQPILRGIWITGLGEDYMRELEDHPSVARKIGVKAVVEGWGLIKGVAAKVLGDLIMGR